MDKIKEISQQAKIDKKKLVLVTGVFDVLHQEHLNFLVKAKEEGDILLVGIETDKRVSQMKGKNRPANNQKNRLEALKKLEVVDHVFILPESFSQKKEHLALLKLIKPDVLAVSSHSSFLEQKKELMSVIGGQLKVVHQFNPEFSTTKILGQQQAIK